MKESILVILVFLLFQGCIEPFEAETLDFEGALVVDARITNEEKQHQVVLTRARPFEQDDSSPERNATVTIEEGSGISYTFEETSPGQYTSTVAFGAKSNESYQLKITTSDGAAYSSTAETMPDNVPIADIEIKRATNDFGEDGVSIILDNESLGDQPRYFRYDYEENYKIVAPNWDPVAFNIIDSLACVDGDAFEVGIKQRDPQKERICYGQDKSKDIILVSTANLENNTVSDFEVRFVNRENYILTHRYSILVNQYSQSVDAHSYYQSLEAFSVSESVFNEIQPGFLSGNITSMTDDDQNVIGYFETAAVSSKRVFFNYEDLFPDEELPEYPVNCRTLGNPRLIPRGYHCTEGSRGVCDGNCDSPLIGQIQAGTIVYAGVVDPPDFVAPYLTRSRACGDCTVLGSDVKPDFWID
ncbi:DUF4249 domain-containing protein [Maribacter sp. 2307UL18-2]|uniref:DUF4249 domain-containing protein n=1 Tax=Maribacter sp. 2307UL18-2 TaxID=3386274 RepID=UPI0039BCEEE4